MAPSASESVTIDRAYFETLVRRSNYNNDVLGSLPFASSHAPMVTVPKAEYENLVLLARQFANLKRSLMGAGVTEENIATLVQDLTGLDPYESPAAASPYTHNQNGGYEARPTQTTGPATTFQAALHNTSHGPNKSGATTHGHTSHGATGHNNGATAYGASGNISQSCDESRPYDIEESNEWAAQDPAGDTFTSHSADGPADAHNNLFHQLQKSRPSYVRNCRRTIMFCNLPNGATLWDVTSEVRGGQLLDVFLRATDRTASVSFVHEEDAVRFYEHTKKNDIYIKNKRVLIKWADRHYTMPGHIANKLAGGTTRNLIIRRCGAQHTADSIREDLDHIHNMTVIKVDFIGGSCFIKTNSVHNAIYAKNCMMSRAKYKGSRIDFDADECEQDFEAVPKPSAKPPPQRSAPAKAPLAGIRNRFDMLRVDDEDNDNNNESDDKFDTSAEIVNVAA